MRPLPFRRRCPLGRRILRALQVLGVAAAVVLLLAATPPGRADPPDAAPGMRWSRPATPLVVSRPFQPPPTPYAAGHRGVDLVAAPGQVVRAAGAGTVSYAAPLAGRGVVVVVHGALRTTYEPVTASVHRGEVVTAGAPIGTLDPGHAGCPASACLHWGLLRGDVYLDPLSLLGPQPVRLLPLTGAAAAAPAVAAAAMRGSGAPVTGLQATSAAPRSGDGGPDTLTWSLVAAAGAGALAVAGRRR